MVGIGSVTKWGTAATNDIRMDKHEGWDSNVNCGIYNHKFNTIQNPLTLHFFVSGLLLWIIANSIRVEGCKTLAATSNKTTQTVITQLTQYILYFSKHTATVACDWDETLT